MKKSLITISLIIFSFVGYSQKGHVIQNPVSQPMILDFLKNGEPEVPKTQIMTDYLKTYQEKNAIKTIEMPALGLDAIKNSAKNMGNIDNMIVIRPNLAALIKMPIVKPDDTINHTLIITEEQNKQSKPLK
jgi:hypothetical protein